jgi:hypothetical protein
MIAAEQVQLGILTIVDAEPEIGHRQLAEGLGVSFGKTPYLRNGLLDKGHIKVGNFLSAEDKRKSTDLLTPERILAKMQLPRNYLVRKKEGFVAMKAEIEVMRVELGGLQEPMGIA